VQQLQFDVAKYGRRHDTLLESNRQPNHVAERLWLIAGRTAAIRAGIELRTAPSQACGSKAMSKQTLTINATDRRANRLHNDESFAATSPFTRQSFVNGQNELLDGAARGGC
jgi:hypothetical protein